MIYISSNNVRYPVTKTFTTLHPTTFHYTCQHFTSSHINITELHFTTLSFGLTPYQFPTASFHLTSLHFTSLHLQMIFAILLFLSFHPIYNCFPDPLSNITSGIRIVILLASCQQTCMTYTIAVCTVKNSWWWTEKLFETCRVSFQNKFEKLVHLVGLL
jgi:hypothetical protein